MKTQRAQHIAIGSLFIWAGFIAAISFMEAWMKFRAPGVTLQIGLGIGRMVFAALNKVEWVLALLVIICAFVSERYIRHNYQQFFAIALGILLLQSAWLLPGLDERARLQIAGESLPHSNLHIYYVAAEFAKAACLISSAFMRFKHI